VQAGSSGQFSARAGEGSIPNESEQRMIIVNEKTSREEYLPEACLSEELLPMVWPPGLRFEM
jgi:hypothetical protein